MDWRRRYRAVARSPDAASASEAKSGNFHPPSCPRLSRASTSFFIGIRRRQDVDGRVKSGHDGERAAHWPTRVTLRSIRATFAATCVEFVVRMQRAPAKRNPGISIRRHARAWRGHPRLSSFAFITSKTWMAGSSPAMTRESRALADPGYASLHPSYACYSPRPRKTKICWSRAVTSRAAN